jgi:hypothetical protein
VGASARHSKTAGPDVENITVPALGWETFEYYIAAKHRPSRLDVTEIADPPRHHYLSACSYQLIRAEIFFPVPVIFLRECICKLKKLDEVLGVKRASAGRPINELVHTH